MKTEDILAEILDGQFRGEASLQALYRSMVSLMVVQAGVGSINDPVVERETAQALLSVFPRSELKPFVALPSADKAKKLSDLSDIVLGIRLYNRAMGKGGRDIDDVPTLSVSEASQNEAEVEAAIEAVTKLCQGYVEVIAHVRATRAAVEPARVPRLTDELNNRRQYSAYLERLLEDVKLVKDEAEKCRGRFNKEMASLKAMVGAKQAVHKDQVYPKFIVVARLWKTLMDLVREDRSQFRVLKVLTSFTGSFRQGINDQDVREAEAYARDRAKADAEGRLVQFDREKTVKPAVAQAEAERAAELAAAGGAEQPVRMYYEATPDFMQLPVEYKGFCPHSIVTRDGLLLLGDSSLGLVRYRKKYYALVDEGAVVEFMQNPERYISEVLTVARRHPALIYLIGVQDRIRVDPDEVRADYAPKVFRGVHRMARVGPPMHDAACETPTHFVESYIDPHYNWNEWAMRKKALLLFNLKDKLTRSQQTDSSHFRRENESQHYEPKDATAQTRYNTGTTIPKTLNYIQNLRGHPDKRAKVVSVTIDNDK